MRATKTRPAPPRPAWRARATASSWPISPPPSRDVPGAEDALADAFAAALAVWPAKGVPANPEGWLAKTARRRLIDAARRRRSADAASDTLALIDAELKEAADADGLDPRPASGADVRLRSSGDRGVDSRALDAADDSGSRRGGDRFRLPGLARRDGPAPGRAKAKIRLAGVPFKIPEREDLPDRLGVALEAIYAAFSHGWAEAFSDDPRGRNLAEEAIWLGRVVVSLAPNEPEAMGLLALMLYAHSRREARRDAYGRYVPLSEQDAGVLGPGGDRRGGRAPAGRERLGRAGTLPARGRGPVRPRRPPADRNERTGTRSSCSTTRCSP